MFYLKRVVLEMNVEDSFRGVSVDGEECEKTIKDFVISMRDLGIEVVQSPNGVDPQGTLWVTDDLAKARGYAKQRKPVLGVLDDENLGQDVEGISYLAFDVAEAGIDYLEEAYRRQAGIPYDILETERCLVRETAREDAEAFYQIYADPSVTAHMEDLPTDRDAFFAWLDDYSKNVYGFLGYGIWTVLLKRSGIIGRAGLTLRNGFDDPELGYLIAKPWQGQGLAFEVCSAILEYAQKLGIPRVLSFAETTNEVSIGLLAKLGFERECQITLDGRDCIMFSRKLS